MDDLTCRRIEKTARRIGRRAVSGKLKSRSVARSHRDSGSCPDHEEHDPDTPGDQSVGQLLGKTGSCLGARLVLLCISEENRKVRESRADIVGDSVAHSVCNLYGSRIDTGDHEHRNEDGS